MGGQAKGKKKNKPKRKDNRPNKGNAPSGVVRCPATHSNTTDMLEVYNNIVFKESDCRYQIVQFLIVMMVNKRFPRVQDAGFVGLSPQERMKVRMHEKAKKKSSEKYTVLQLLEKVRWKKWNCEEDRNCNCQVFPLLLSLTAWFLCHLWCRQKNTWTHLISRWLACSANEPWMWSQTTSKPWTCWDTSAQNWEMYRKPREYPLSLRGSLSLCFPVRIDAV